MGRSDTARASCPVQARGLVARYGKETVLDGVDFDAPHGKITAVLGGSGSGKSTLLRCILGLLSPAGGAVRIFGEDITAISSDELTAIRSRLGVLFQNGALFSSMTVGENVAMAIREATALPEDVIDQMVRMKLSLVDLEPAIHKYPEALSGGMKKRAALARAIAADPEILFCDEPTAGLDPVVAAELDELLLNLRDLFDMTMVVVTHELASIETIADQVVMLAGGGVLAAGGLDEVSQSDDTEVRHFFDRMPHGREERRRSLLNVFEEKARDE